MMHCRERGLAGASGPKILERSRNCQIPTDCGSSGPQCHRHRHRCLDPDTAPWEKLGGGKRLQRGGTPLSQVSELLDLIPALGTGWWHPEPPASQFLPNGWAGRDLRGAGGIRSCLQQGLGMLRVSAWVSTLGITVNSLLISSNLFTDKAAAPWIHGMKGWETPRIRGVNSWNVTGSWDALPYSEGYLGGKRD